MSTLTITESAAQAGTSKADLIAETKAMVTSVNNTSREIACNLATLRDRHGMTQQEIGNAMGKTQPWVSALLKWHDDGFKGETPFGSFSKAARKRKTSGTTRRRPNYQATDNQRSASNRLFEVADIFFKSELEKLDDKTFDRVMVMFAEWRQAAKAVVKIGKETSKSLDALSEGAKQQIPALVAGKSAYAADDDFLEIPTFLRRGPISDAKEAA